MLSIGLMSGTSMDGIDAALLETDGTPALIKEQGFASLTYDSHFSLQLKATEYAVRECQGNLDKAKANFTEYTQCYFQTHQIENKSVFSYDEIEQYSTEQHIKLIKLLLEKYDLNATDIDVIGYHGQTLFHKPATQCSIMLGSPQYMADVLGIKVIYDFRRKDLLAGGQGAPFAPLYHQALAIRDNYLPLAVVNCGGISNITLIISDKETDLLGFDTGPGNALIDTLVRLRTNGLEHMDKNGQYGKAGRVNSAVIKALYEQTIVKDKQNYFSQKPPKSLDYGDMKLIPALDNLSLEDACATLEAFTADTIVESLKWVDTVPTHWILAGGGWHNPVILRELKERLQQRYGSNIRVMTADEARWNNQALEAQIFAYFAVRSLLNKPLSVPGTTGVAAPMSGGECFVPLHNSVNA